MFKEFRMKNTIKVLGIIALIAVIGFSFAACYNVADDDNGGGGGSSGGGGGDSGGLTVTGIGNYGVNVYASGSNISTFVAASSATLVATGGTNNGYKLWVYNNGLTSTRWTGTGSFPVLLTDTTNYTYYYATVNFTNGNGSANFSSFTTQPTY